MSRSIQLKEIILVPAIISLIVTLVRLAGEMMGGPDLFFNPSAGGGGALIRISWLIPIFGIYFAWKLIDMNAMTTGAWKTLGVAVAGFDVIVLSGVISTLIFGGSAVLSTLGPVFGSVAALLICRLGWRELYDTLIYYAFAARIPVAIIMLVAMLGNWQTHYDVPPPGFPELNVFLKWILIGLLPQLIVWIAVTVIGGFIFAVPVMLFKGRNSIASASG